MAVDPAAATGGLRTIGTGALQALAGNTGFARITTGTYTGDGATSQAITGVGFQPVLVVITKRLTSDSFNFTDRETVWTSDQIVDDNADGGAVTQDATTNGIKFTTNSIISLNADGFTVDDNGVDVDPNENTTVYNFYAIG